MSISLNKLIVPSKTIKEEMPGFPGFTVELSYLTRDELMNLRKKATTSSFNRRSKQLEEEVDSDLFQSLYIQNIIKGWSGLKFKYLTKLVPVDLSEVEDPDEGELEFSYENAEILMKNSTTFDSWVTDVLDDVENFTQKR